MFCSSSFIFSSIVVLAGGPGESKWMRGEMEMRGFSDCPKISSSQSSKILQKFPTNLKISTHTKNQFSSLTSSNNNFPKFPPKKKDQRGKKKIELVGKQS